MQMSTNENKLKIEHSPHACEVSGMSTLVCVSKIQPLLTKITFSSYQCAIELLMSIDRS